MYWVPTNIKQKLSTLDVIPNPLNLSIEPKAVPVL